MKNRVFLCGMLLLLLFSSRLHSQELKVESFGMLERDLLARTNERLDLNDEPCAVVRVSVPGARDFTFDGNVIGAVSYRPGEAIVYMSGGSRRLQINSDRFGTLEYYFPDRLRPKTVYRLSLRLILPESRKTRTLVMPVVGIGEATSAGIMLGIVRKWGGYVKVKYSFTGQATDLACDNEGYMAGTSDRAWFTGESVTSRMAVTAGGIYRLSLPFYLYAGLGYGYKKVAWEMVDDRWAEASDHTSKGLESEVGAIYRIRNFAFSAGVQNNRFKYWESTLGVALMF